VTTPRYIVATQACRIGGTYLWVQDTVEGDVEDGQRYFTDRPLSESEPAMRLALSRAEKHNQETR
jgi:hypothetical protein